MKIVVCVKQIPVVSQVVLTNQQPKLDGVEQIINPYDEYTIEEGIALKERFGGQVIALSVGKKENDKCLRDAMSVGADEAVLVQDDNNQQSDVLRTSYILSKAIQKIGNVDIVIAGKVATDGNTHQTAPALAGWLKWNQLIYVKKIEQIENQKITVWRITNLAEQKIRSPLPVVISVVKEINEPRLPSLKGKMAAKKYNIPIWSLQDIGIPDAIEYINNSAWRIREYSSKKDRPKGTRFIGEPEEVVNSFIKKIREDKIL